MDMTDEHMIAIGQSHFKQRGVYDLWRDVAQVPGDLWLSPNVHESRGCVYVSGCWAEMYVSLFRIQNLFSEARFGMVEFGAVRSGCAIL
jgi:hypothetical protein